MNFSSTVQTRRTIKFQMVFPISTQSSTRPSASTRPPARLLAWYVPTDFSPPLLLTYRVSRIVPQAIEDDVVPLSEPIRTKYGELIDSLTIAKGTLVVISIESMNRSATFWGEDAKVFRPSRWLEDAHGQNGIPAEAKEIQGYRHLLTFADGQRTCPGRKFVVTEIKVRLRRGV
jgi:hypothetical protein